MALMLNPAATIVRRLGGPQAVAEVVGKDQSTVYRWGYPRTRHGTGGVIPQKHWRALIEAGRTIEVVLTPDDFLRDVGLAVADAGEQKAA